jgi:hypothetical protein
VTNQVDRFELSLPLILWYFPVGYLATVLAHSYQPELSQDAFKIHLLALVVACFTILYLYLGIQLSKFFPKHKGLIGLSAIFTVGILRGFVMYYIGNEMGIDSGLAISARISVSWSATLFWLILLAYLINSHREYRANYRLLLSQALISRSAEISEIDLKAQLSQVEKDLKSIRLESNQESDQSKWLSKVANEVKAQIDDSIRPLSHRLWLAAVDEYPKVRVSQLITDSIRTLNYQLPVFLILIVLISLTTLPTFVPSNEAFGRILIMVGTITTVHYLFKLIEIKSKMNMTLSITKLLMLTFLPTGIGDIYYSLSRVPLDNPISFVVYLIIPAVCVSLSILDLVKKDQQYLIDSIASELQQLNSPGYQTKQMASYLHNSLQSELLAIAKQLEQVAKNEDEIRSKEILEQLGGLINRSISEDFQNFYASPKQRLLQVIENWHGILNINISNVDLIFEVENGAIIAVQLIEELASNAVKHSAVTELNIYCSRDQNKLSLAVDAADGFSSTGFGSEFIRSYLVTKPKVDLTTQSPKIILEI